MIYIYIKKYSQTLALKQPWYTIRRLEIDLKQSGNEVEIVTTIPTLSKNDILIKTLSLKDVLYQKKPQHYNTIFLLTFAIYAPSKWRSVNLRTIFENFYQLDRIIIMSLIPKFLIKRILSKARFCISISDRCTTYLQGVIKLRRYIPFDLDEDPFPTSDQVPKSPKEITYGYFGPPYMTRNFFEIVNLAVKFMQDKKFKFVIRKDDYCSKNVKSALTLLHSARNVTCINEFFTREQLAEELREIDVVFLPFQVVMAEFPVVVLEAIMAGKLVFSNDECGLMDQFSGLSCLQEYNETFIINNPVQIFELLHLVKLHLKQNRLKVINKITMLRYELIQEFNKLC